jgi:hypothetical protein
MENDMQKVWNKDKSWTFPWVIHNIENLFKLLKNSLI